MSKWKSIKPKPNFFWSIVSIAAVMYLFGFFALIAIHSRGFVKNLQEEFEVVMDIAPGTSAETVAQLQRDLEAEEWILPGSVSYLSKEEGLEALGQDLGADLAAMSMPNPLLDVVKFRLKGAYFTTDNIDHLGRKFKKSHAAVVDMYYQEGLVQGVVANISRLSYVLLGTGVVLGVLSLMLMYNAIRLSLYANRFLIRNMELVGASWSFIRRPFLAKSLRNGTLSAILAVGGLSFCYFIVVQRLPEVRQYFEAEYILYLIGGIVLTSLSAHLLSTWMVVTRFLRMSSNQLHI